MTEPQEPRSTAPNHLAPEELSECAFSPETAAAGWLEHAEGCAECSARLADLRLVLTQLAELPEPELPESVAIRLDAAVARAWQEADADAEREAVAPVRRGNRRSWRKIAVPLGSLALIVLAVVGVGSALHGSGSNSATSSAGPAIGPAGSASQSDGAMTDSTLASWVRSILPGSTGGTRQPKASTMAVRCATVPQLAGYTVLTTSHREFENVPATLVVYRNAQEPSSSTVYAVVYEGSCPSSKSAVLARGSVSR